MALPAYVTVTDAAGRVLFRRPATQAEIDEAIQVADAADAEAQAVLKRIAEERQQALAASPPRPPAAPEAVVEETALEPAEETELEPFAPAAEVEEPEQEHEEVAIQESGDEHDFDFLTAFEGRGPKEDL